MENTISSIPLALELALSQVLATFINFIPQIIAAIAILILGSLVAKWVRWIVIKLFEALHIGKVIKDSPVEQFLEKAEVTQKIELLLGNFARWFVLLIFFITAVNVLGLTPVSNFLNNILSYIPRIISALLIFVLGMIVAGFAESFIKGSLSQISVSTGRLVSKIGSYIILVFTILASLAELGIAQNLINALFIGFIAMLALGFGLAFGLGAKDLVAKILDEWYTSLKKDS